MTSTICAIMTTYNRGSMIRGSIDAILAQSRRIDQIIIVNDGSTDDTEQVVKSYGDRVTLVTKKNGGKASGLNAGLAHCTADYVWFCDDDDYTAPDGVEALAKILDDNPSIDIAMGKYIIFREENGKKTFTDHGYLGRTEEPNLKILFLEHMITALSAMLVRNSLYAKTGLFSYDVGLSDDYHMILRLLRNTKAVYVPKVIYYYRRHEGPRGNDIPVIGDNQKVFNQVRKNYGLDEFTPTFALAWNEPRRRRAALCERACVMARRALWHEAVEDFRQAAQLDAGPLSVEELSLIQTAIYVPEPYTLLSRNAALIAEMRAFSALNNVSYSIAQACLGPLMWNTRRALSQGNFGKGFELMRQLFSIAGFRGACARIMSSIIK